MQVSEGLRETVNRLIKLSVEGKADEAFWERINFLIKIISKCKIYERS